jgi:hypothetical protein
VIGANKVANEPVIGYAMPKIGCENPDDQYTEEETARRRDDAIRSGVTIRIRYPI